MKPLLKCVAILVMSLITLREHAEAPGSWNASIELQANGRVQVSFPPSTNSYHVLFRGTSPSRLDNPIEVLLENPPFLDLAPPKNAGFYRVKRIPLAAPEDSDGDGLSDVFEALRPRYLNPVNAGDRLRSQDGAFFINDRTDFEIFSERDDAPGALAVRQLKFVVAGVDTDSPLVYFMNSKNHPLHAEFVLGVLKWNLTLAQFTAETYFTDTRRKNVAGSIVAYDRFTQGSSNGLYAVEFWPADPIRFDFVRRSITAISAQMPWAAEQFAYHPTGVTQEELYRRERTKFDAAALPVVASDQLFANLSYSPVYTGTAFGILRLLSAPGITSPRDIIICPEPPNELGHVAGIISASAPAPLSHFALLARQNRTPSAYLRDALSDLELNRLAGKLVQLNVTADRLEVREATLEEVLVWEESVRPKETHTPTRDLSEQRIRSLTQIGSKDAATVGSKAANLGELLALLPAGMVPEGYSIPFYFYDEFMKHNGFYEAIREMRSDPAFLTNTSFRHFWLANFQKRIVKESSIPASILLAMDEAQRAFPIDTRIRCRSSSNNEDAANFNGAGLYDSFTHRPDEGALINTVKQVWASLWNARAYDEREFQRIDHFASAMGVLLHPSYPDESANGVAVTRNVFDPNWPGSYVNAQVGEDLVTNPEPGSVPDEFLASPLGPNGEYELQYIRYSNRTAPGERVLTQDQIEELIFALEKIQSHFQTIYGAENKPTFAMDIEFKITADGRLNIKQARPWIE
jgi:pyruvate, water dikinase